jgi:2-polyprenyl-3-methyl-5-hydroxy-6-metoxy-1,4-benzoquinol methylase
MIPASSFAGKGFGFGRNWSRFLRVLSDERLALAEDSLREMLELNHLIGKSFLDVGSGSGLFSLAAVRLGASRVHSFDFDLDSVHCTKELKRRYSPDIHTWTIERGSALDEEYLRGLGQFDIVYSWGVLHCTGDLWGALRLVALPVAPGGRLFIAIYNDQGFISGGWRVVKRTYNAAWLGKTLVTGVFVPFFAARGMALDLRHARDPTARYRHPVKRGMSITIDWRDWLGGYPFEVARPERIQQFFEGLGFMMRKLRTCGRSHGNNEFVFAKPLAERAVGAPSPSRPEPT